MEAAQKWYSLFSNWPSSLPRGGVMVTDLNETMPFREFWLRDGMLLIERTTPDAMGARFVVLNFEAISVVKFTAPLSATEISAAGFQAEAASRQPAMA